jgi:hypothetical protein
MMWSQTKGNMIVLPKSGIETKCSVDGCAKNSTSKAEYMIMERAGLLRISKPNTRALIILGRKSRPKKFIRPVNIMPKKVPTIAATAPT